MTAYKDNTFSERQFIYTCPEKVFSDPTITLNELKIYMMIRSFMDTTGIAYPSNRWLADKLGINLRNTINNINKLVSKGYLERIEQNGQRYLIIPTAKIEGIGVSQKTSPHVAEDTPPHVAEDTQLYKTNINTKIIKERPKPVGKASRTPVPEDFSPSDAHREFGALNGMDVDKEAEAFVDYYKAHGKRMVNWNSAFSNWLRKSLEFKKPQKPEHPVTASIREIKETMRSREFLSLSAGG